MHAPYWENCGSGPPGNHHDSKTNGGAQFFSATQIKDFSVNADCCALNNAMKAKPISKISVKPSLGMHALFQVPLGFFLPSATP